MFPASDNIVSPVSLHKIVQIVIFSRSPVLLFSQENKAQRVDPKFLSVMLNIFTLFLKFCQCMGLNCNVLKETEL